MDISTRILILSLGLGLMIYALFWMPEQPSGQPRATIDEVAAPDPQAPAEPERELGISELERAFLDQRLVIGFDEMLKRRRVRVLVVRSQTDYFYDGATQRGLTYDLLQEFEKYLNKVTKSRPRELDVAFVPLPRDELIPALLDGRGDIVVANLTITPERSKLVDFSEPIMNNVQELLVTHIDENGIESLRDLSGKQVHVRVSSSYYQSLLTLNRELQLGGHEPVELVAADEHLEDEDLLEMVNAGLIGAIIVDSHKAHFWNQILDNILVNEQLILRSGADIAWAFRPNSTQLARHVNGFLKNHRKGSLMGNILFKRYLQNTDHVTNALSSGEIEKFNATSALFKIYADRYGFDWLMLMAQAYQESRLDHSARSRSGAVGIMQLKPSTARDKNVNIPDISSVEDNIHAGTKYLRFIRDHYFSQPGMTDVDRTLFSFAAYNAGPGAISRLRESAEAAGLNPDLWFDNVELLAAKQIGREPVRYVRNIYRYYIAYRLSRETLRRKAQARSLI